MLRRMQMKQLADAPALELRVQPGAMRLGSARLAMAPFFACLAAEDGLPSRGAGSNVSCRNFEALFCARTTVTGTKDCGCSNSRSAVKIM